MTLESPARMRATDMPRKALRPCSKANCRTLTTGGRCPKHQAEWEAGELERQREVNARRPDGSMSVYSDPEWRAKRGRFIEQRPRCRCGGLARYVDHIRPWRSGATEAEREALFWNVSNWQPMCGSCHSRKTVTQDGGFGRRA